VNEKLLFVGLQWQTLIKRHGRAVPNVYGIHSPNARPFRLIAAQIETFATGVVVGIVLRLSFMPLIRTLQLRHLTQAATE